MHLKKIKSFVKGRQGIFNWVFLLGHIGEEIKSFFAPVLPRSMFSKTVRDALHGDERWKTLVKKIIGIVPLTSVVETGTYKGDTTEFLAKLFSKSVFTCEVIGMYFRESKRRLGIYPQVRMLRGSSPALIQNLVSEKKLGNIPLFFLDAHWYGYWPLKDEMAVISKLPKAIIMIDDFKVPGRPQFGYDTQRNGDIVIEEDINYLKPMLAKNCMIFFPKYEADGSRDLRGYIIIFQNMGQEFQTMLKDEFVKSNYEEHQLQL